MSQNPQWERHAATGQRYFRYRQNGQIGYQLEDGSRLNQRQFDQLADKRNNQAAPRSTGSSPYSLFPREEDQGTSQDPLLGTAQNYTAVPREQTDLTRSRQDPSYTGPGQTSNATTSEPQSRAPVGQRTLPQSKSAANKDAARPAQYTLPSRLSRLCTNLVSIEIGNYSRLSLFILGNKAIVSPREIECLSRKALEEQIEGREIKAQTLVHHACLLKRCEALDEKERTAFFKQLDDRSSATCIQFLTDVKRVYTDMKALARKSAQDPQSSDTQSQGRGLPLEYQAGAQASRHGAESHIPGPQSLIQVPRPQVPGVRISDILPRISRQESMRLEPYTSVTSYGISEISDRMATVKMKEAAPSDTQSRMTRSVGFEDAARSTDSSRSYGDAMSTPYEASTGRPMRGTEGDFEQLDPRYTKRSDPKKFFMRGRVFALLWHEPAGRSSTEDSTPVKIFRGKYGEEIYSHIIRMVVIKEGNGAGLCLPIATYGGKGVSKPGFSKADRESHSVIYMSDTKPKRLAQENDLNKKPIAVDKASPDQKLDPLSRINFSRVHTVAWNVKVMNIGKVTRESEPNLVTYWKQTMIQSNE